MLQAGTVVGGLYQIVQKIGSGGTGDVYLAYHLRLNKYVVVKKIKDNFVGKINIRAEVDILKRLKHTYLPLVYDFIQLDTQVYTVMDYIEGYDLEAYIKAGNKFDEETITKWLKQLCEVLQYLHSQNPPIIHSDVKPGNIMVTADGNICLIDFNISLDGDDSSQISGISLPYASPEQYNKAVLYSRGQEHRHIVLDGRSDMYSLGATFYQLMSGVAPAKPFEVGTPLQYMNTGYSEALLQVIDKSMNMRIENRYENMSKMISDINSLNRKTRQYKTYLAGMISGSLMYLVIMCLGIWLILYGMNLNTSSSFEEINNTLIEQYENSDYVNALNTGIEILNDDRFDNYLKKNKNSAANIYYIIGECYFNYENAQYSDAADYYEKAIESVKNNADADKLAEYYRNYIVSLVRAGEIISADDERIEEARSETGDELIDIVKIGLTYNNKDYYDSISLIDELLKNSNISDEEKLHILIIGCDAANNLKDYDKCIKYMKLAYEIEDSMSVKRKLASAYWNAGINNNKVDHDYIQLAIPIYEELFNSSYSTLNDGLTLSMCYKVEKKYKKAVEVLKILEEKHTDFRIYMEMGFNYHYLDDTKNVLKYIEKFKKVYNNEKHDSVPSFKDLIEQYD